jgi:large subunit ribosomal protein L22
MAETEKTEKKAKPARKVQKRARVAARKAAQGPNATLRYLRIAPRKVRLVAANVRGMKVGAAIAMLKFTPNAAAKPLSKLLRSAIANAETKGKAFEDVDALFVKTLTVDQGPKMRRFMPRAMGRAYRVEKKTSHVYVELGSDARA